MSWKEKKFVPVVFVGYKHLHIVALVVLVSNNYCSLVSLNYNIASPTTIGMMAAHQYFVTCNYSCNSRRS